MLLLVFCITFCFLTMGNQAVPVALTKDTSFIHRSGESKPVSSVGGTHFSASPATDPLFFVSAGVNGYSCYHKLQLSSGVYAQAETKCREGGQGLTSHTIEDYPKGPIIFEENTVFFYYGMVKEGSSDADIADCIIFKFKLNYPTSAFKDLLFSLEINDDSVTGLHLLNDNQVIAGRRLAIWKKVDLNRIKQRTGSARYEHLKCSGGDFCFSCDLSTSVIKIYLINHDNFLGSTNTAISSSLSVGNSKCIGTAIFPTSSLGVACQASGCFILQFSSSGSTVDTVAATSSSPLPASIGSIADVSGYMEGTTNMLTVAGGSPAGFYIHSVTAAGLVAQANFLTSANSWYTGKTPGMVRSLFSPSVFAMISSIPNADQNIYILTKALVCHSTCKTCSGSASNQCTACFGSIVLNGGICVCDTTCSTCTGTITNCVTCPVGKFLKTVGSEKTCDACTAEGWFTSGSNCLKCDSNCVACSGAAINCLKCTSSQFLGSDHKCYPCNSNCKTCSITATNCTSCDTGKNIKASDNTCMTCGAGFFVNTTDDKCYACDSTCATCTTNSTNCLTCSTGNFFSSTGGSTCAPCGAGSFVKSTDGNCYPCDSNCKTCVTSATNCLSCNTGMGLSATGNTCVSCTGNNFVSSFDNKCKACDSSCTTCSVSATNCTSCPSGRHISAANSICMICGDGFFVKSSDSKCYQCDSSCATCSGTASNCLSCSSPKKLKHDANVCMTCGTGNFVKAADDKCYPCNSNCLTCEETATKCLTCNSPLKVSGSTNTCITCGAGKLVKADGKCYDCSTNCKECSGSETTCTACNTGQFISVATSNCMACGDGFFVNSDSKCQACDASCSTCVTSPTTCSNCPSGEYIQLATSLCGPCNAGFFVRQTDKVCVACSNNCATCSGTSTNCLTCLTNNYLDSSNTCVLCNHPDEYISGTQCLTCHASCASCSGSSCTTCQPGTFKYTSTGLCGSCSEDKVFLNSDSNQCEPCHSSCNTCSGSAETQCLSCDISAGMALLESQNTCIPCDQPMQMVKNGLCVELEAIPIKIIATENPQKKEKVDFSLVLTFETNFAQAVEDSSTFKYIVSHLTGTLQFTKTKTVTSRRLLGEENSVETFPSSEQTKTDRDIQLTEVGSVAVLDCTFTAPLEAKDYKVKYSGDLNIVSYNDMQFAIQPFDYFFNFTNGNFIDPKEVEQAKSQGKAAGSLMLGGGALGKPGVQDTLAVVASLDPSGTLQKFLQVIKIFNRIYFINLNFGPKLNAFLESIEKFSNTRKQPVDLKVLEGMVGYKGKLSLKNVLANILSALHWRLIIYFTSFILNISILFFNRIKAKVSKFTFIVFYFWPRIHLLVLNAFILDFTFYSVRGANHFWLPASTLISKVVLTFIVIDLINMVSVVLQQSAWNYLVSQKKLQLAMTKRMIKLKGDNKIIQKDRENTIKRGKMNQESDLSGSADFSPAKLDTSSKNLDHVKTWRNIGLNLHLLSYFASPMREDKAIYCMKRTRLFVLLHFVRICAYQILIPSCQYANGITIIVLMVFEFSKVVFAIVLHVKYKVFLNISIFLGEIIQSTLLFCYLVICLFLLGHSHDSPTRNDNFFQTAGIYIILGSVALEYVLLVLKLFYGIKEFLRRRKLAKLKNSNKILWFLVYKKSNTLKEIAKSSMRSANPINLIHPHIKKPIVTKTKGSKKVGERFSLLNHTNRFARKSFQKPNESKTQLGTEEVPGENSIKSKLHPSNELSVPKTIHCKPRKSYLTTKNAIKKPRSSMFSPLSKTEPLQLPKSHRTIKRKSGRMSSKEHLDSTSAAVSPTPSNDLLGSAGPLLFMKRPVIIREEKEDQE